MKTPHEPAARLLLDAISRARAEGEEIPDWLDAAEDDALALVDADPLGEKAERFGPWDDEEEDDEPTLPGDRLRQQLAFPGDDA